MYKLLFENTLIPKIVSGLILGISVITVCVFEEHINISEEFKSSYLTALSILTGFLFSIIIFVNDQLAQLRYSQITNDSLKQAAIRYAKFYGRLTHRLVITTSLAIILIITLLFSYCDISHCFSKNIHLTILWSCKLILCCCSFYFWILAGVIFKSLFSFITHRKSETVNWLYSIKFNDSHYCIDE